MLVQEAVILSSKKVCLRKFRYGEADLLNKIASDPGVIKFCGDSQSIRENKDCIRRILSSFMSITGLWALVYQPTMEFAGYAGLVSENQNMPEFQVAVFNKFHRKGLDSEALKMCMDHAARNLPSGTVEVYIRSEHKLTKRMIRKAGFKFTRNTFLKGKAHEIYVYTPDYGLN